MSRFDEIREKFLEEAQGRTDSRSIYELRKKYLDRKAGEVNALMKEMRNIPKDEKADFGKNVNLLKDWVLENLSKMEEKAREAELQHRYESEKIDVTIPADKDPRGNLHPITQMKNQMVDIFAGMGFEIYEGTEIENDYYNFTALNTPMDHPARDMQDTFYIDPNTLLRTHTTAMQMRELEKAEGKTPIKLICPGKVYRRDDDDATHSHQFMQCEGLVVGEHITLADLKGTLEFMANRMFGEGRTIRFRPSYFPFTEPSVEVDVSCPFCNGKGCSVCKGSGWIEILGAGMVHPHVLEMNGFDPEKCTGFAFGVGLERVAMLKYGIDDIRNFYTNDARFLKMFDRFD